MCLQFKTLSFLCESDRQTLTEWSHKICQACDGRETDSSAIVIELLFNLLMIESESALF